MTAPIDYSKWDHIIVDDDDDESDDKHDSSAFAQPRVTRLDQPSRITNTGDGWRIEPPQPSSPPPPQQQQPLVENIQENKDTDKRIIPTEWTEKGSQCNCFSCVSLGHSPIELYWSQDRYSVTLHISLPSSTTKGWKCFVTNIMPYEDRFAAVGTQQLQQLIIQNGSQQILFQADLSHPTHLDQDETDIDWNVEYTTDDSKQQQRFICIALKKAVPMQGITLWWKKPFVQCNHEIEMEWRKRIRSKSNPFETHGMRHMNKSFKQITMYRNATKQNKGHTVDA